MEKNSHLETVPTCFVTQHSYGPPALSFALYSNIPQTSHKNKVSYHCLERTIHLKNEQRFEDQALTI